MHNSSQPGNWTLECKEARNRGLLYYRCEYEGKRGVFTILLTRPLQQAVPLCTPPYTFMRFVPLEGDGVGIQIRRVNPPGGDTELAVLRALVAAGGSLRTCVLEELVPAVSTTHRRVLTQLRDQKGWASNPTVGVWEITESGRSALV
jgi:hypothetical protein